MQLFKNQALFLISSIKYSQRKHITDGPPYPQVLNPQIQPSMEQKYSGKKIPENSKKQNLNFPLTGNCEHFIYNYLYSFYIVLGIISNLGVI